MKKYKNRSFGLIMLVLFVITSGWAFWLQPIPAAAKDFSQPASPSGGSTTSIDDWFWQHPLPQGQGLNSISCPTDSFCKAVGEGGVILSWNGSTWSADVTVGGEVFQSVACVSDTFCKAVGPSFNNPGSIISWDGVSWSVDVASTTNDYVAVACQSTTLCKAVGYGGVIYSWNGTAWSDDTSPTTVSLYGVACTPSGACKAVGGNGTNNTGRIISWNGTTWSNEVTNASRDLNGVDCPTNTLCKAVGGNGTIRSWNGTTWGVETSGTTNQLNAVSCSSITQCKATGGNGATVGTILAFNGSAWSADTSGTANFLFGVSCPIDGAICKSVGEKGTILNGSGSTWSADYIAATNNDFKDISCPSASYCKAAGSGGAIMTWSGAAWSADTSGTATNLLDVSCSSASQCKATGVGGLILSWNGTAWSVDTSNTTQDLYAVSCTSDGTFCMAVGFGGNVRTWTSGTSWNNLGDTFLNLYDIACTSALQCFVSGTGGRVAVWDGSGGGNGTWTDQTNAAVTLATLWSIECASATQCKAAGGDGSTGTVISWNGTEWSLDTAVLSSDLRGVACSPDFAICKATGLKGGIFSWPGTGTTWTQETSGTSLTIIEAACPSNTLCKAVGNSSMILGMANQSLTNVDVGFALDVVSDGGCLDTLIVTQNTGVIPNAAPGGGLQGPYWTISSGTCTSGFNARLTLPAPAGVTPTASDKVCRYTGTDTIWDCVQNGFTASTISRSGVSGFSNWAYGVNVSPTALDLLKFTANTERGSLVIAFSTLLIGLGAVFGLRKILQR